MAILTTSKLADQTAEMIYTKLHMVINKC